MHPDDFNYENYVRDSAWSARLLPLGFVPDAEGASIVGRHWVVEVYWSNHQPGWVDFRIGSGHASEFITVSPCHVYEMARRLVKRLSQYQFNQNQDAKTFARVKAIYRHINRRWPVPPYIWL